MSGSRDGTIDGLKSMIDHGMAHSMWDANFADANFPTDGEGRTLHLGTRVRVWVLRAFHVYRARARSR